MKFPIYLDNNATTRVDPRVVERMVPYFSEHYGNASSKAHALGWAASEAVDLAREQVASLLEAEPHEITFTAGSTESLNTAIKGIADVYQGKGRHLVTTLSEHKAVLDTHRWLERHGFSVTYLPVGADGRVDVEMLEAALTDETILVSVMWANNEVGTLQPISEIAKRVHDRGALLLTDATQAIGKVPVRVADVDVLACSAHKFYGPKGVGALYVRKRNPRVRLSPLLHGGSQEGGQRAGTLNVPGIVGIGAAAQLAQESLEEESQRLQVLRDRFETALRQAVPDLHVNSGDVPRLPQTSSVVFRGVKAANLMAELRTLAVSAGSACSSGTGKPSHVLTALGLSKEEALSTIRFSLGRFTTEAEMDYVTAEVIRAIEALIPLVSG